MSELEAYELNLTDEEIVNALWISRKIANDRKKCFEGILGQVLEIMLKDKANKIDAREVKKNGPKKDRPEYYVDKINYSWVTSKDKYDTRELNSSDMCAAVRLAMMQSKKTGRNFVILLGIAEEVITGVKKEFGLPGGPGLKN